MFDRQADESMGAKISARIGLRFYEQTVHRLSAYRCKRGTDKQAANAMVLKLRGNV